MKMHDRHIVGRAALREMEEIVGQSSDVPYSPEMGPGHHPHSKCRHSMSVIARHRGEERAGAIGPAWHAGSGILGIGSESPRASMSDNCAYRIFEKGTHLWDRILWAQGGLPGFSILSPRKIYDPPPPEWRLAREAWSWLPQRDSSPGRIAFLAGHIAFQGVDRR